MTNNLHIFGAIILTEGINVVVNFKPGESKEEIKKLKIWLAYHIQRSALI